MAVAEHGAAVLEDGALLDLGRIGDGEVEHADGDRLVAATTQGGLDLRQVRRPAGGAHPPVHMTGAGVAHQAVVPVQEEHRLLALVEVGQGVGVVEIDAVLGQERVGEAVVEILVRRLQHLRAPEDRGVVDQARQLLGDVGVVGRGGCARPGAEDRGVPGSCGVPEGADLAAVIVALSVHIAGQRAPEGGILGRGEGFEAAPKGGRVPPERADVPVEGSDVAIEGADVAVERADVAVEGSDVAVIGPDWARRLRVRRR